MPNESFFMAMAGLGVSLAGFAGLILALDQRPIARSPIAAYRITTIVFLGFALTIAGFGTVVAYTVTGQDLNLTIRVSTLLLAFPYVRGFVQSRPGPAWPKESERLVSIVVLTVLTVVTLANLIVASLGYLELLMLAALIGPVLIFYTTIRDATRLELPVAESDSTDKNPG